MNPKNKHHQKILLEIKKVTKKADTAWVAYYLGHTHIHYGLDAAQMQGIAREWTESRKDIALTQFVELLDVLYAGKSYEEKAIASILLARLPKIRKQINPKLLNVWLNHLEGWAEIDSLCQSRFTANELLDKWSMWEKRIRNFAKDVNINKKRAALVLLTGTVRASDDKKLADLAFEIIDILKAEKSILITKAISWLLRDLTKHHRKRVENYLNANIDDLPKIAIRETKNKLKTGKK